MKNCKAEAGFWKMREEAKKLNGWRCKVLSARAGKKRRHSFELKFDMAFIVGGF